MGSMDTNDQVAWQLKSIILYWKGVLGVLKSIVIDTTTTLKHNLWPRRRIIDTNIGMQLDNDAIHKEHAMDKPFVGQVLLK